RVSSMTALAWPVASAPHAGQLYRSWHSTADWFNIELKFSAARTKNFDFHRVRPERLNFGALRSPVIMRISERKGETAPNVPLTVAAKVTKLKYHERARRFEFS